MSLFARFLDQETVLLELGPRLDFRAAEEFKEMCSDHVENGVTRFILDFHRTEVLDSTGLGAIFGLYRQINRSDGCIVFVRVPSQVEMVIQLTRTYKVFKQFATVEAARKALRIAEGRTKQAV